MERYAVGYKGWVEIREGKTPPRQKVTHLPLKFERIREVYDDTMWGGEGGYRYTKQPVTKKVKHTVYLGGEVIATLPASTVRARLGMTIPAGAMIHLLPEQLSVLLPVLP